MDLLFFFEWLDSSMLASLSKAWGGVFAVVQTIHLASLALLGGMVIVLSLRLLNILMRDIPADVVVASTRPWINRALIAITLSGIYQASAVAIKLYYNSFFWSKMIAFFMGIAFLYGVMYPLLSRGTAQLPPWTVRLMACASLVIWFSVAATGRWIGFS